MIAKLLRIAPFGQTVSHTYRPALDNESSGTVSDSDQLSDVGV